MARSTACLHIKYDSTNDAMRCEQRAVDHSNQKGSDWTGKDQDWYLFDDSSVRDTEPPGQKWKNLLNQREISKASFPKKNEHQGQSKQVYCFFVQFFLFRVFIHLFKEASFRYYSEKTSI